MIHGQFIALQVDPRKERVFGKGVIGQQGFALVQNSRDGAVLLAVAAEQEKDLGLEGVTGAVPVKIREEGILLEDFEEQIRVFKGRLEQTRQGGLPHPDNTFDGKIHAGHSPQKG